MRRERPQGGEHRLGVEAVAVVDEGGHDPVRRRLERAVVEVRGLPDEGEPERSGGVAGKMGHALGEHAAAR